MNNVHTRKIYIMNYQNMIPISIIINVDYLFYINNNFYYNVNIFWNVHLLVIKNETEE